MVNAVVGAAGKLDGVVSAVFKGIVSDSHVMRRGLVRIVSIYHNRAYEPADTIEVIAGDYNVARRTCISDRLYEDESEWDRLMTGLPADIVVRPTELAVK